MILLGVSLGASIYYCVGASCYANEFFTLLTGLFVILLIVALLLSLCLLCIFICVDAYFDLPVEPDFV